NNRWCVAEITAAVGGSDCGTMEKVIDRQALMRQRGGDASRVRPAERLRTAYVPRAALPAHLGALPNGSLLLMMTSRPGIFVSHVGFVFVRNGERRFRHASELRGRVIEEPLAAHLQRAQRTVVGAKVCAMHG